MEPRLGGRWLEISAAGTERQSPRSRDGSRRLSVANARSARPLRLKILTAGPRDSAEKFAGQMAYADRQLGRFRVLNGLDVNDKLSSWRWNSGGTVASDTSHQPDEMQRVTSSRSA